MLSSQRLHSPSAVLSEAPRPQRRPLRGFTVPTPSSQRLHSPSTVLSESPQPQRRPLRGLTDPAPSSHRLHSPSAILSEAPQPQCRPLRGLTAPVPSSQRPHSPSAVLSEAPQPQRRPLILHLGTFHVLTHCAQRPCQSYDKRRSTKCIAQRNFASCDLNRHLTPGAPKGERPSFHASFHKLKWRTERGGMKTGLAQVGSSTGSPVGARCVMKK